MNGHAFHHGGTPANSGGRRCPAESRTGLHRQQAHGARAPTYPARHQRVVFRRRRIAVGVRLTCESPPFRPWESLGSRASCPRWRGRDALDPGAATNRTYTRLPSPGRSRPSGRLPSLLRCRGEDERAGAAGGRTGTQAGGIRRCRTAHRARLVRRRPDRVRLGRTAPVETRAPGQAHRGGATLGEAALWLELTAPPHPLFHFGMTGGFKTPAAEPFAAQVRAARGPDGVATPFREDPDTPRRRWRARDDRWPPPRAHPAARRSGTRTTHCPARLRPAAGDAGAQAVLRDDPGAGRAT